MKIQLLTAVTILALSATTAQASRTNGGGGHGGGGSTLSNTSDNALAIGNALGTSGALGSFTITQNQGHAVAGSISLEGNACDCDFKSVTNDSGNAIAVGHGTAGSIRINTMGRGGHGSY